MWEYLPCVLAQGLNDGLLWCCGVFGHCDFEMSCGNDAGEGRKSRPRVKASAGLRLTTKQQTPELVYIETDDLEGRVQYHNVAHCLCG